jgi:hypothetical protein
MTEPIIVAEFQKNSRECVRVMIDEFKGQTLISVRVFYRGDGQEWRPGRAGIGMAVQHVGKLADALAQAKAKAIELRLIAPSERDGG